MERPCVVAAYLLLAPFALAQTMTSVGVLPGETASYVSGVSGDGAIVSATGSGPSGVSALRWTAATGLVSLGAPEGFGSSMISGNGSTIVLQNPAGVQLWRPGGVQVVPSGLGYAHAINGDGSVVVGREFMGGGSGALRWAGGGVEDLGALPGHTWSSARGVSEEGSVVVGNSWESGSDVFARAWKWTPEGMEDLGVVAGGSYSAALAVTPDAAVVVGVSGTVLRRRLVLWTPSGIQDLGVMEGYWSCDGYAASADASTIVGEAIDFGSGVGVTVPMVWSSGFYTLEGFLTSRGVDLTGWELQDVKDVSWDGTVLVGNGKYFGEQRGWMVMVPAPGGSGALIVVGIGAWQRRRAVRVNG
jgi:probable HAF family extracellular repeat protein